MVKRNNILPLPNDILSFQILPRLPARSLGRFMCVCKQWRSFLTTPVFTKMHLHHVNNQNHHKFLAASTAKSWNYFCTIDCEVGLSANRPLPFEVGSNEMSIISSLNGLVCVGINGTWFYGGYNYLDIILWNPLTGDYKTLSKDNNNNCFRLPPRGYGLYYSSCDDDYKLLAVTQSSDAYIYSWTSDSWRKAKSRVDSLMETWDSGCLVNGKLYFLAKGTQGGSSEISSLIIRFDTKTEMFTEITTPYSSCSRMMVERGCIHLSVLHMRRVDPLELWKMGGDGDNWTKVIYWLPIGHAIKDGYTLRHSRGHDQVYVFKVEGNKSKKVCQYTIDNTMLLLPRGKFVETIVSLKW